MLKDPRAEGSDKWNSIDRNIGFVVYASEDGRKKTHLTQKDVFATSGHWTKAREVAGTYHMQPDMAYYVVPSSFQPNRVRDFSLRIHCDSVVSVIPHPPFANIPQTQVHGHVLI